MFNYEILYNMFSFNGGPGGSSGKMLGYRLDDPGSMLGVRGMEIFLHSFLYRLVQGPLNLL